jgi:hypothetical protein
VQEPFQHIMLLRDRVRRIPNLIFKIAMRSQRDWCISEHLAKCGRRKISSATEGIGNSQSYQFTCSGLTTLLLYLLGPN